MMDKINNKLASGDIVAINYFANMMDETSPPQHSLHSSSLVGRKWRDGKCMYKIRNSWGEGWNGDDQGYKWVSEELLAQMMYGIDYLE